MTLDPTPAANLPTSAVPGWLVVGACLSLLLLTLYAKRIKPCCRDPRCPICGGE